MTRVDEIAADIFIISTCVPDFNLQFNEFLTKSNAEVAGFEASLTATVEEAVADVEISKERETAQAGSCSPGP